MNDRRIRVLFINHTAALGGGEIALFHLAQNLDSARYQPIVLLCSEGPLHARLLEAGIETHVLPLASSIINTRKDSLGGKSLLRFRDGAYTLLYIGRLAAFIRQMRPDIVHTNSLKADIIGGLAARLAGAPLLWHVRDRIDRDYLPASTVKVFRRLARLIPQFVIANSQATLDTILRSREDVGTPSRFEQRFETRTRAVHDGVLESLAPTAGADGPVVGIVGRISPWKGQHIFLQAAALVHKQFPHTRFQVIGSALFDETAYEVEVRALSCSLHLQETVEFTGFRNDVADLIGKLDILVHASTLGEPFGQVVAEGMAAGKPVVATRGGGIPEIVLDGENGLLVPMGDAPAMATAICRLLADPEGAKAMGRSGKQRIRDYFTIARTAENVGRVYEDLLQQSSRRREPNAPRYAAEKR